MLLAVARPSVATLLLGLGLAGLGAATVIPAAFHAADEVRGLDPGVVVAAVRWLLRVGFLVAAPLVGLVAEARGLRVGLLLVVLAAGAVALLARALPGRRAAAGPVAVGSSSP